MTDEMRQALRERRELIEQRSNALVDAALTAGEPWITSLGDPPLESRALQAWRGEAVVVAAYRGRYGITSRNPLGPAAVSDAQRIDAAHAAAALRRARNHGTWSGGGHLASVRRLHENPAPRP